MTYEQALDIIHQTPWKSHEPTLDRIRELMALLGDPQDKLRYIHIAGSNGKGSTAALTASILQAAGYRVGLCTSPYIHRFNERMKINSVCISDDELSQITEKVFAAAQKMSETPTEFEFVNAITFEFFTRHDCEIVVLEVGLGGRLDA
ncbi:MAG: bifunctional folylpolyglutamate synthase/dihydrofolate synthase, partial [Oscillospiraceae bacterium]|nr:bifunctional folylpolyglutamate synthase/dihydrofolate synthase [Oscillospiraceae bacterium]